MWCRTGPGAFGLALLLLAACTGQVGDRARVIRPGDVGPRDVGSPPPDLGVDGAIPDVGDSGPPDDAGFSPDAIVEEDQGVRPDLGPLDAGGTTGQCTDGVDNDGDGLIDRDDLGCTHPDDTSEGGLPSGVVENEWTVFEPAAGSRIVYVSRSVGSDSNDGLSPEPLGNGRGPKATLAAGRGLLRAGNSDWLLLRRGDSWSENLRPDAVSGRSATEPTIIGPYGTGAAPRLTSDAYFQAANAHNIALLGIDFGSNQVVLTTGSNITDILIEGCRFSGNPGGAVIYSGPSNLTMRNMAFRNNVIRSTGDNAAYFVSVTNALIEGNIIYRPSINNQFNHAMYVTRSGNSGFVTRKNLIFMGKPGGMGIMQRPGGISEYNVIADVGATGIPMGECNDEGGPGGGPCFAAVAVTIRHNLIAGIRTDASPGLGVFLKDPYIASGAVEDNIVADSAHGDFQLVNNVTTRHNRRSRAPYQGAPAGTPLLAAYHLSIGGSGDADTFFLEAMDHLQFHAADPAYQAMAVITYAETLVP